jgi:hypothetical protein
MERRALASAIKASASWKNSARGSQRFQTLLLGRAAKRKASTVASRTTISRLGLARPVRRASGGSRRTSPFIPSPRFRCSKTKAIVLYEASAINRYLERKFPTPALVPRDAQGAALTEQWISAADSYFVPHAAPVIVASAPNPTRQA